MSNPSLLILAGAGFGPEVMNEVKKIIGWYGEQRALAFDVEEALAVPGGRRLIPCTPPRFRRTEWLGWAAWLFLLGAVCEIADDFMPDPYSDYLELGTQVCWIADSFMYMLDQVRRF